MLVFVACDSSIPRDADLQITRDSAAVMHSYGVSTLISDSGFTRYRVTTPEWQVYDKLARPCWIFPNGLHLQQFEWDLTVSSEMDANHAIYYSQDESWFLTDSVQVVNKDGDFFETDTLYVLQKEDRVYTHSYVRITQKGKIITGVGMESNQNLTKYTILNPQGVIPIDE